MPHRDKTGSKRLPWGQILLVIAFPLVMIPLGWVDMQWTVFLHEHEHKWLGELMKRTVFQGWEFGASDPAILFQLMVTGFYFAYSRQGRHLRYHQYRPYLGFLVFCALFTGLGLVHSVKWVMGRARPNLVFDKGFEFSGWYEFGPQFITDGIFYGSFPSGHTATVFLLITVAYWLINHPDSSRSSRIKGWIWGGVVIAYSLLMVVGRCMTFDHWITDSIGIILLSWIFIHLIYFRILKIPAQIRYVKQHERYAPLPRFWELDLLWRLFFMTLGVMSIFIGARSLMLQRSMWLAGVAIPGAMLAYLLFRNVLKVYSNYMTPFQPFFQEDPATDKSPELE